MSAAATPSASELERAARELILRARSAGWAGADPFDALWDERWPDPLTGGRRRRQALIQLHARAPIDIRRVYRRKHPVIAKALATFGLAATRLYRLSGSAEMAQTAHEVLTLLCEDRWGTDAPAWGYPFPVQTRWSYYSAGTPNVVVTSFAVAALTEAASVFGVESFSARAQRAGAWVLEQLFDGRQGIFVYHRDSDVLIHNANLLGARAAAQSGVGDDTAGSAIGRALESTLRAQRADGSWPYGSGPKLGFVDSFHTGFVLDCLTDLAGWSTGAAEAASHGARYYLSRFFGDAGEARLWPDRRFPEDAHSAGTGLSTIAALARAGIVDAGVGAAPARRVLTSLLRRGHCVHRRWRWGSSHVHYPRWCDGHVALGLASYALAL